MKPRTLPGKSRRPGKSRQPEKTRKARLFRSVITAVILLLVPCASLFSYPVTYREQYYRLYHLHYIQAPDDSIENIYWLEKALAADFANPLHALARVGNRTEWEKYRYLFTMHLYLKLIEQYIFLGNKWNKREAYFFNAPFREQNLESLETAETCYRAALSYWEAARGWAEKSLESRFRWINLRNVQHWEDEAARMESGELDYGRTLERELANIRRVREAFRAMDESTY